MHVAVVLRRSQGICLGVLSTLEGWPLRRPGLVQALAATSRGVNPLALGQKTGSSWFCLVHLPGSSWQLQKALYCSYQITREPAFFLIPCPLGKQVSRLLPFWLPGQWQCPAQPCREGCGAGYFLNKHAPQEQRAAPASTAAIPDFFSLAGDGGCGPCLFGHSRSVAWLWMGTSPQTSSMSQSLD